MAIELSCGLPPGPDFIELAFLAESLGYSRVWVFDTASLWEDPFVHLALAAERTSRIGLGTAVLIPHERSEMAMASAIATIARLSDGRFRACFGTGASARRTMGQRPLTLATMRRYVTAVRGLLAGETVTIDGQPVRMLHHDGLTAARPVDVEIWLSVFGPRGIELATEIADGIITGQPMEHELPIAMLMPATVLDPGEDRDSARVRDAVGPWKVVSYHEAYSRCRSRTPSTRCPAVAPGAPRSRNSPPTANAICSPTRAMSHTWPNATTNCSTMPTMAWRLLRKPTKSVRAYEIWANRACGKSSTRRADPTSPVS